VAKTTQKPRSHILRRGLQIFKLYLFPRELGKDHLIYASINLSNSLILQKILKKSQDLLRLFRAELLSEKTIHQAVSGLINPKYPYPAARNK